MNSAQESCWLEPEPTVAQVTFSGFAFAAFSTSCQFW